MIFSVQCNNFKLEIDKTYLNHKSYKTKFKIISYI